MNESKIRTNKTEKEKIKRKEDSDVNLRDNQHNTLD